MGVILSAVIGMSFFVLISLAIDRLGTVETRQRDARTLRRVLVIGIFISVCFIGKCSLKNAYGQDNGNLFM